MVVTYQQPMNRRSFPGVCLLFLEALPLSAFEPGSLDEGFQPPVAYQRSYSWLSVIGDQLYVPFNDLDSPVRRLHEDGTPDPSWKLKAPVGPPVTFFAGTSWGGWLAGGTISYEENPDGSYVQLPVMSLGRWFAQDDGSLLGHDGGSQRLDPEGRELPAYAAASRLSPLPGALLSTVSIVDSHGRMIVAGNFVQAGNLERHGLVRLLSDGSPDPTWNPGSSLGIILTNTPDAASPATLTAVPTDLVPGTNDSVVVSIQYAAPPGSRDARLAVIASDGTVSALFPDPTVQGRAARCVQPDGRILLSTGLGDFREDPAGKLIRLEADGTPDPTFRVTVDPPDAAVSVIALDAQGRVWMTGTFGSVNGVLRPKLARVFAYEPKPAPPALAFRVTRSRIAPGEVLHLAAEVQGNPPPEFRWERDGLPIQDATHRGLRLPIAAETVPAAFRLLAWNSLGTNVLDFGRIEQAELSPRPGSQAPVFGRRFPDFGPIRRLLALPDGRVLFGAGSPGAAEPQVQVGRLTRDGDLDPTFGVDGVVKGLGRTEDLIVNSDGSILVTGTFTSLAGSPAWGLAQLTADGQRVLREFPIVDPPSVTTALPESNGGLILAGRFSRVAGLSRFRLARLKPDLSPDPDFDASATFEPWQVVDVLCRDAQGRLLAGGGGIDSEGPLTNPTAYGLLRLRENGSADPGFKRLSSWVRSVFVEPDGNLVAGMPLFRLDPDGRVLTQFDSDPASWFLPLSLGEPYRRVVRLSDGHYVAPTSPSPIREDQLQRWLPEGRFDNLFTDPLAERPVGLPSTVFAAAVLSDDSTLLAVDDGLGGSVLRRVLPDSDRRLENPTFAQGRLSAGLPTQPGRVYRVESRSSLKELPTPIGAPVAGDGYLSPVGVPSDGVEGYLNVHRE